MANQLVDDAEEVRVERRLVEDVASDPFTCRNTTRPLVVTVRVAQKDIEERGAPNLRDVDDPKRERQEKNAGVTLDSISGGIGVDF